MRSSRVARNFLLVSAFLMVGKLSGAAKEMAIAYRYGVDQLVDVYLFVITWVLWFPGLWLSVLATVLVPLVHRISGAEYRKFNAEMQGLLIIAGVSLALLCLALPQIPLVASNAVPEGSRHTFVMLSSALAPLIPLALLIHYYSVQLLAEDRHSNTLFNAIPAIVLAVCVLFWPGESTIEPFVAGCLVGFGLQLLVLLWVLRKRDYVCLPAFRLSSPVWKQFRTGIGVVFLSQLIIDTAILIDLFVASRLGLGAVSQFGYSIRLLDLALGLLAMAIARALLPVLSQCESAGQRKSIALHWTRISFCLGVLSVPIGWLLTPWGVGLVFERGAFTAADTEAVSTIIRVGLLQMPFLIAARVLVQYFSSEARFRVLLLGSVFGITTKLLTISFFSSLWHVQGVMLSTVAMYVVIFGVFLYCALTGSRDQGNDFPTTAVRDPARDPL